MSLYLVTGGAGFIGSHLCAALLEAGHSVRVLDDLSTGKLANLLAAVEFHRGCVADPPTVAAAMSGVAGCFHLAAIASVQRAMEDWPGAHRVNQGGSVAVLDAARAGRVPVVYASSAAVYGDCPTQPIREDAPKRPLSAYGVDKLGSEMHAAVAAGTFGVPTAGLRFFNVYGPRQDARSPYSGVISIFADRIARGEPVQVFGDGLQTRDFIFVADVVAALLAAMEMLSVRQDGSPAAPVFNVCTGQATSVLDLAHTLGALSGRRPVVQMHPPRSGEIHHSVGCRDAAVAALRLGPPTPLADGLAALLAWPEGGTAGNGTSDQVENHLRDHDPQDDRESNDDQERDGDGQAIRHDGISPHERQNATDDSKEATLHRLISQAPGT